MILTNQEHKQLFLFIEKYGLNFPKLSSLLKHSPVVLETYFFSFKTNREEFNIEEQRVLLKLCLVFENQWNLITESFNYHFQALNDINMNSIGIKRTKQELLIEFHRKIQAANQKKNIPVLKKTNKTT